MGKCIGDIAEKTATLSDRELAGVGLAATSSGSAG